jgi:DNA-binding CsgD family transcriptional regulator
MLVRIAETSGGNPYFAIELARAVGDWERGEVVLPNSLQAAVRERLRLLEPEVMEALQIAAACASPRVELVERTLHSGQAAALLSAAEDDGVIELRADGGIRFAHPLLAAGVAATVPPSERRRIHVLLSTVVADIEERARHLALAAIGPDAETLRSLEMAADQASRRGAPGVAAELRELAMGLGVVDPELQLRAAEDHFREGAPARAQELLEAAIKGLPPGGKRAEALALMGTIRVEVENFSGAAALFEAALEEAEPMTRLHCSTRIEMAFVAANIGKIAESIAHAARAIEEAERLNDAGLLAEALGVGVLTRFLSGEGVDWESLERALLLEDQYRNTHAARWPSLHAAMLDLWCHRLDASRERLATVARRCTDFGAETDWWHVSFHAAEAAAACGDIAAAEQVVAATMERSLILGTDNSRALALTTRAHFDAWRGDLDGARAAGQEAMDFYATTGMASGPLFAMRALGMAELSAGNPAGAIAWLAPAAESVVQMGLREPAVVPFLPDAAEGLTALGRVDEASPIVELLEARGRMPEKAWTRAVGARCWGLLLTAQGQLDEAADAYARALATHDEIPHLRYDRARTLLVMAQLQRRANQRSTARESLREAIDLFEAVGALGWANRARGELDLLGLRPGSGEELTPMERQVARLVASGSTNRDVAAALFMSPKTVEAHLGRVYRKLGIHSRAELGWHMAERADRS